MNSDDRPTPVQETFILATSKEGIESQLKDIENLMSLYHEQWEEAVTQLQLPYRSASVRELIVAGKSPVKKVSSIQYSVSGLPYLANKYLEAKQKKEVILKRLAEMSIG